MKKYIFAVIVLGLAACGQNKTEEKKEDKDMLSADLVTNPRSADGTDTGAMSLMPTMDFKDTFHSFGALREGEIVSYDFEFTNKGRSPLVITNAKGSCGCTVADYPNEPVAPGKGGVISVKFNSEGKTGHQEKSVTVSTNSNRGMHMLNIKAEVSPK
jgi:hypothetical protein